MGVAYVSFLSFHLDLDSSKSPRVFFNCRLAGLSRGTVGRVLERFAFRNCCFACVAFVPENVVGRTKSKNQAE